LPAGADPLGPVRHHGIVARRHEAVAVLGDPDDLAIDEFELDPRELEILDTAGERWSAA